MSKPWERMGPAEIIGEIGSLCSEMQSKLVRIRQLSDGLYHKVRRSPVDDNTAVYLRYATNWARFASTAYQGVRRAASGDKMVRRLATERPETVVKPPVKQASVGATPVESLLDLYREDDDRSSTEAQ